MKDYQLYLEKITNALSRAGISYPAPSFSDYEGMWSYVEGLSSFLELNAQLQKSGAGVVLMGLEESTTFRSYWNSEFYQEFQERKLLESKIYSNSELSEIESDGGESEVPESAEFSPDAHETDSKTKGLATGLVVGSVVGSVIGSSLVDGVDASEPEVEGAESEEVSPLEGYNSSNVVFIDDEEDEEEVRYDEDGFVIEDEDDLEDENGSGSSVKEVSPPTLEGYDSSNIVFVDDDDDDSDAEDESSDEDELQYDEDGFVIEDNESESEESSDDGEYTYDEFGNKYDKDGFIVLDDDDEDELEDSEEFEDGFEEESEDSNDGYTYDEFGNKYDSDGFLVEDEDEDSSEQEGITYEPDGTYYDEYGNHFDSDGFLIEDEDEVSEEDDFPAPTKRVSVPSQPSAPVREAREEVVSPPLKPKIIMPKEVQTADKIMSLFGGMESKLRRKVQDVKKPKN